MLDGNIREWCPIYGTVSLHSPREQGTTIYVGSHNEFKGLAQWFFDLRGTPLPCELRLHGFFPGHAAGGEKCLVSRDSLEPSITPSLDLNPAPNIQWQTPVSATLFPRPQFTSAIPLPLTSVQKTVLTWRVGSLILPSTLPLEAIDVSEGDFLKTDGGTTLFQGGAALIMQRVKSQDSVRHALHPRCDRHRHLTSGEFKAKSGGETELALQNFQFGAITGEAIPAGPHEIRITVEGQLATGDVNRDGVVSILDLILVARQLGQRVPAGSPVDLNGDGVVSILDLILAAQGIGNTTASAPPAAGAESVMLR